MLKKNDIIKILEKMNLPKEEYWVVAGSALVVHGVKEETSDIDLGCTTYLTEYFIDKGCKYRILEDNTRIVEVNEKIELLENWYVDKIERIAGYPIGSLESIKKQKLALGREKDFEDIKLIDDFLKIEDKK